MMSADGNISEDLFEKIVAFVDREAGRGAPLTEADDRMVRQLIQDDPAVRALVGDLQATNAELDTILDDVAAVEVPAGLVAMIQGHGSSDVAVADPGAAKRQDEAAGDGGVVAFRKPAAAPRRSYGPLAAAASIALLISSGALYHIYNTSMDERSRLQSVLAEVREDADSRQQELADARAELQRLSGLAELASDQSRQSTDQLIANEEAVQRIEVERAALEGRYAALEDENERLSDRLERQRDEVAENETAFDELNADLADARQALAEAETRVESTEETLRADIDELTGQLDRNQQEMAALTEELEAGEARAEAAGNDLAGMLEERESLERRLATLESDKQRLETERQVAEQAAVEARQQLASIQSDVQDAESRLAVVAAGLTSAEAGRREAVQQVFALQSELADSTNWLSQISQYHRIYASTSRRHLVEVGADEVDHIQTWLTGMLGREILVPDLSAFGVTFAGARLLGVNDRPVAQLVYLDADDQPLALCIIPSSGEPRSPAQSTDGELNLVDWRDGDHDYAVVGWSDPALLNSLTDAIRPAYDL